MKKAKKVLNKLLIIFNVILIILSIKYYIQFMKIQNITYFENVENFSNYAKKNGLVENEKNYKEYMQKINK